MKSLHDYKGEQKAAYRRYKRAPQNSHVLFNMYWEKWDAYAQAFIRANNKKRSRCCISV